MSADGIVKTILDAERERRATKAQEYLEAIDWYIPSGAKHLVGRLRAQIELLRFATAPAAPVDLREVARGLDQTVVEAIQSGDLVKAREAVALAITLDDRQGSSRPVISVSDSAELVDSMLDAINEAGQLDGYSVWTEVGPERWAQSGAQGAATAYIEIVTPGEKLAECAHLIAFPMPTEKPASTTVRPQTEPATPRSTARTE